MEESLSRKEQIDTLKEKIKDVRVAMLTTYSEEEGLRSRPMATSDIDDNGDIWFFTKEHSGKTEEVESNNNVCVSYSNPDSNTYVSVQGTASVVTDRHKMEELYTPVLKAWFPDGLEDPELALLKISVESAEYWDSSSSKIVTGLYMLRAAITGKKYDEGSHGTLTL